MVQGNKVREANPWARLSHYDIVLGSQSPRRVELLAGLGLPFRQIAMPDIDESYPEGLEIPEVPRYIAERKAEVYRSEMMESTLLITADTVVEVEGEVLGKPTDADDARRMLTLLSGRAHYVHTGVCISTRARRESFVCSTRVIFAELSQSDIDYYIEHYRPYDKAGAYGIQEWIGYRAIKAIEGSFYNVMGLPVHLVAGALDAW